MDPNAASCSSFIGFSHGQLTRWSFAVVCEQSDFFWDAWGYDQKLTEPPLVGASGGVAIIFHRVRMVFGNVPILMPTTTSSQER